MGIIQFIENWKKLEHLFYYIDCYRENNIYIYIYKIYVLKPIISVTFINTLFKDIKRSKMFLKYVYFFSVRLIDENE